MTILIAEDAPIDAIVLRNILEHAGHRAVVVKDGEEAVAALGEHPEISMVVADVHMPIMSGVELVRAMRERPDLAHLPVVFVSGAADAETVREAVALKPAAYILKPLNEPSRVLERVNHALEGVVPVLAEEADVRRARGLDADQYREARAQLAETLDAALNSGIGGLADELATRAYAVGAFRLARILKSKGESASRLWEREMRALKNALGGAAA